MNLPELLHPQLFTAGVVMLVVAIGLEYGSFRLLRREQNSGSGDGCLIWVSLLGLGGGLLLLLLSVFPLSVAFSPDWGR